MSTSGKKQPTVDGSKKDLTSAAQSVNEGPASSEKGSKALSKKASSKGKLPEVPPEVKEPDAEPEDMDDDEVFDKPVSKKSKVQPDKQSDRGSTEAGKKVPSLANLNRIEEMNPQITSNSKSPEKKATIDHVPNTFRLFDFIFPGGKLAKLVRSSDPGEDRKP